MALSVRFPTLIDNSFISTAMRTHLTLLCAALLLGLAGGYSTWLHETPARHYLTDLRTEIEELGGPADWHGNLLSLNPALYPNDYSSPQQLSRKLDNILLQARDNALLTPETVVILPAQIGTWLLLSHERPQVYSARSLDEVKLDLTLNNPLRLLRTWLFTDDASWNELLLRMKAQQAADDYLKVFAALARKYAVTLHAGSITLPSPQLLDGRIVTGYGELQVFGLTFASDGSILGPPRSQPLLASLSAPHPIEQALGEDLLSTLGNGGNGPPIEVATLRRNQSTASSVTFLRGRLWPVETDQLHLQLTAAAPDSRSTLLNFWIAP